MDGTSRYDITNEITNGEVLIKWKVWAAEGPATGDFAGYLVSISVEGTHKFRGTLSLRVGARSVERVWGTGVMLWHVRDLFRLFAIDGSGTRKKKLFCPVCGRELEGTLRAGDDGVQQLEWSFRIPLRAALSCRVNEIAEFS
jgi:hypothetical protein